MDLPATPQSDVLFLRQEELPSQLRKARMSMTFACAVLTTILGGFMIMWSPSQASSTRDLLSAQLLQEFSLLHQSVESPNAPEELPKSLDDIRRLEQQQQLMDPDVLKLNKRYRSPQDLLSRMSQKFYEGFSPFERLVRHWEALDILQLEQQLPPLQNFAQQSRRAWLEMITLAEQESFVGIPNDTANQVLRTAALVADVRDVLKRVEGLAELTYRLVSHEYPQRILVLIADGNHQRGSSGAFSVGFEIILNGQEVDLMKPVVLEELDQQLRIRLQAPQGLEDITDSWGIQTANTSFDALDSAQQVHWFWQREARSTLDFIVVINSRSLEKLLTPPTEDGVDDEEAVQNSPGFAERWSQLRKDSAFEEMANVAQNALSELGEWILKPQLVLDAREQLEGVFAEQGLQVWSASASLNQWLSDWELLPQIPHPEARRDFLMIGHLSTGDQAVDAGMTMSAELQTLVDEAGQINHWLSLERRHEATALSSNPHESIIRILVPKGSSLSLSKGVKLEDIAVSQYKGYTQWSFSSRVSPGSTGSIEISYQLPWTFDMEDVGKHQLLVMKQPGTPPLQWRHEVSLPANMSLAQILPEEPVQYIADQRFFAFVARQEP